jgi:hypothetical protein
LCEISGSHGGEYEDDRQLSGTLRRVVSKYIYISEVLTAFIIRVMMTLLIETVITSETSAYIF